MKTRLTKIVCCLIMGIFMVSGLALPRSPSTATGPLTQLVGTSPANAQQQRPRVKNLFQLLFERKSRRSRDNSRPSQPQIKKRPASRKPARRASRPARRSTDAAAGASVGAAGAAAAAVATTSKPKVADKKPDAAKVLVVGDFTGDRLANGLIDRFASDPNVVFLDEARGNSGLVRLDVFNWPEKIGELIDEHQPKLVIVAIGMNDRQQMRVDGTTENKFTDEWRQEYGNRVDAMISAAKSKGIPLIWMGLPPVSIRSMNADYLLFNEIYRNKTQASGNKYVDIWDGFTDAEGNFVSAGPDVNGQIVRLRLNDGINFTQAGRDKLAFYVERPLRAAIGLGAPQLASLPSAGPLPETTFNSDAGSTGRTPLMSLEGASIDGGTQLDGDGDFIDHSEQALRSGTNYDLVVKGIAAKPVEGRIDSGWGQATTATTPEKTEAKPAMSNSSEGSDPGKPTDATDPAKPEGQTTGDDKNG